MHTIQHCQSFFRTSVGPILTGANVQIDVAIYGSVPYPLTNYILVQSRDLLLRALVVSRSLFSAVVPGGLPLLKPPFLSGKGFRPL